MFSAWFRLSMFRAEEQNLIGIVPRRFTNYYSPTNCAGLSMGAMSFSRPISGFRFQVRRTYSVSLPRQQYCSDHRFLHPSRCSHTTSSAFHVGPFVLCCERPSLKNGDTKRNGISMRLIELPHNASSYLNYTQHRHFLHTFHYTHATKNATPKTTDIH